MLSLISFVRIDVFLVQYVQQYYMPHLYCVMCAFFIQNRIIFRMCVTVCRLFAVLMYIMAVHNTQFTHLIESFIR